MLQRVILSHILTSDCSFLCHISHQHYQTFKLFSTIVLKINTFLTFQILLLNVSFLNNFCLSCQNYYIIPKVGVLIVNHQQLQSPPNTLHFVPSVPLGITEEVIPSIPRSLTCSLTPHSPLSPFNSESLSNIFPKMLYSLIDCTVSLG